MIYGLTPYVEVAGMKDIVILRNKDGQNKKILSPPAPRLLFSGV